MPVGLSSWSTTTSRLLPFTQLWLEMFCPLFISMQLLASFLQYLFSLLYYFLAVNVPVLPHKCNSSWDGTWNNKFSISNTVNILPKSQNVKYPITAKSLFSTASSGVRGMMSGLSHALNFVCLQRRFIKNRQNNMEHCRVGSDALPVKVSACKHSVNLLFLHCLISHSTLYNNILMYQCRIAQCKIYFPVLSASWGNAPYYGVHPFCSLSYREILR